VIPVIGARGQDWPSRASGRRRVLVVDELSSNPREVSVRVPRARIGPVFEKELLDLLLLGARSLRAARARRMCHEVERGRALPAVSRIHASAAFQETANSLGTPCANRAMQRSRARLVLALDVRSSAKEKLDHRPLFGRVPCSSRLGPRIARIVERGCATPILGVRVSSGFDQSSDCERPERGRREMEGRVADV